MKSLSDYTNHAQTEAFTRFGAFFAFSEKQFCEQGPPGVAYCELSTGLICPKEHAQALLEALVEINKQDIEQDIAENGIEAIIRREIANYECFYTRDISDCVEVLESYVASHNQVAAHQQKHDVIRMR